MTEDDTFRILARPGFEEMWEKHRVWWYNKTDLKNTSLRIPFMREHGWTWLEFVREAKERGIGDSI